MNAKICKRWKNAAQTRLGIEYTVRLFVGRAKHAHQQTLKYLKNYRAGNNWAHTEYLRYRAEQHLWIYAAKQVLLATSVGVVHDTVHERVLARLRAEYRAAQAAPAAGADQTLQPATGGAL